jgi:hypothetical protein
VERARITVVSPTGIELAKFRFRQVWRGRIALPRAPNSRAYRGDEAGLKATQRASGHISDNVEEVIWQIASPLDPLLGHSRAVAKVGGEIISGFGF